MMQKVPTSRMESSHALYRGSIGRKPVTFDGVLSTTAQMREDHLIDFAYLSF